jgi:hypothetical protein
LTRFLYRISNYSFELNFFVFVRLFYQASELDLRIRLFFTNSCIFYVYYCTKILLLNKAIMGAETETKNLSGFNHIFWLQDV